MNLFNKIQSLSQKTASQVHFRAIKDGLLTSIPFLMVAGMMILINFVIMDPSGFMSRFIASETLAHWQGFGNKVLNGSMNIFAILMMVFISSSLAKSKEVKNIAMPIGLTIGCFFVTLPLTSTFAIGDALVDVPGAISSSFFGTQSMFMAIIVSLVATELYIRFEKNEKLKLKIGDNVPKAVKDSFDAIVPVMFTLLIFGAVSFGVYVLTGLEIQGLINELLQRPLVGFTTSPLGFLFLSGVGIFLFSLGIHPSGVIPFVDPVLTTAANENMMAFQAGLPIPHIITTPFRDIYGHIGGTGQTLALVVAIFIFARYKSNKTFGKLTMPTSIFNINEPIIFGFPIVMNPVMMIPFLIIPLTCFVIAYIVTAIGWVSPVVLFVPWSTPPIINAYLASGGDIRNVILQLLLFTLSVVMYIPFLKLHEKNQDLQVSETPVEADADDFSDFAEFM